MLPQNPNPSVIIDGEDLHMLPFTFIGILAGSQP
jgi:hypothetical protein